jgi:hypothetical protein
MGRSAPDTGLRKAPATTALTPPHTSPKTQQTEQKVKMRIAGLPYRLGSTLETLPSAPYLAADPARVEVWRQRLTLLVGVKVGLAWAGNPTMAIDRRRSIALDRLGNLGLISGVTFVSLQKGPTAAQMSGKPEGMILYDWTEELKDFADTAALIEALDLVIAVDSLQRANDGAWICARSSASISNAIGSRLACLRMNWQHATDLTGPTSPAWNAVGEIRP